jgi:hypothetical protein
VYKISRNWVDVLIFYVLLFEVVYLARSDFVKDPTKEQHQILCKSKTKCDPSNDWTSVRGRKQETYMESPKSPRPKKARQVKSKVKSMLIILFDIK